MIFVAVVVLMKGSVLNPLYTSYLPPWIALNF